MNNLKSKEIYVIESVFNKVQNWTSVGISSECYTDLEKAVDFCKNRMNKEELEKYEKGVNRGLQNRFEIFTKDYTYYIKFLKVV